MLNPVDGTTGKSNTILHELNKIGNVDFDGLLTLAASVKIHLSDTKPNYDVVLVGGNIGTANNKENPFGRFFITVCK